MQITSSTNNEDILRKLGRRFARYRQRSKLTQAALAERAQVSKRTIERFEAGYSIQMITLIRILRVFDQLSVLESLVPETVWIPPTRKTPAVQAGQIIIQKESVRQRKKSRSWGAEG
ncbi:MAG: helix-turn-helix domain-containing protein [Candidatus Marinimicrobia bacterium]|nr:helix-turn-helix domain-containing protein [Candidatus Neomarinimicrobiota bacterium]